jgi:hypothetical protein
MRLEGEEEEEGRMRGRGTRRGGMQRRSEEKEGSFGDEGRVERNAGWKRKRWM